MYNSDHFVYIILDYWVNNDYCFMSCPLDIISQFKSILKDAEKGLLLHWLQNKESYLAYIVLMSQFSRQIYRNTKYKYQNDKKVLLFIEMALDTYLDQYTAIEKTTILRPYFHSENIQCHLLGMQILNSLISKETNIIDLNILKKTLYYARGRMKIIKQFNRFPKRNYILRRVSTEDEIDYMDSSEKIGL